MTDDYQPIRAAIRSGDTERARSLLRPLLRQQPTADAWVLAAQVAPSRERATEFLRRALMLDPAHEPARRALSRLEVPPSTGGDAESKSPPPQPAPSAVSVRRPSIAERRAQKRRFWNRLGCVAMLLLGFSCSAFALNAVGIVQGVITTATIATGGPTPVLEVEGRPVNELPDAAALVPPSQSEAAIQRDTDILEPGYSHEYTFEAGAGDEVIIYVQFLSVSASAVSQNVAILNADDVNIVSSCQEDRILQGETNVVFICSIRDSGTYRVRVLGTAGESVGAYFVGVETLRDF